MNHRKLKFTNHHSPITIHGFTLIELLIVIAVLGILTVGVLIALNVTGTIGKTNLAKVKTFAASVENDLSINQVGKWSFEDFANPGKDTSGYGNNATNNEATWQTAEECGLGFGGCLQFDGENSYLEAASQFGDQDFKTTPFTIALWVNPSAMSSLYPLIYIGNTDTNKFTLQLLIRNNPDSPIFVNWHRGASPVGRVDIRSTALLLPQNAWSHIVITHNGTEPSITSSKIYFNGNNVKVALDYGSWGFTKVNIVRIGAGGSLNEFFPGRIDEVAIYKEALTSYQIQQLYAQGLPRHQLAKQVGK